MNGVDCSECGKSVKFPDGEVIEIPHSNGGKSYRVICEKCIEKREPGPNKTLGEYV